MNLFELNKNQQKAFNKLKRAYEDCEKSGILFVNQYGDLTAYNKELIIGFGDDTIPPEGHNVKLLDAYNKFYGSCNIIRTCKGMADDDISHVLGLTDKGKEIYESEY